MERRPEEIDIALRQAAWQVELLPDDAERCRLPFEPDSQLGQPLRREEGSVREAEEVELVARCELGE